MYELDLIFYPYLPNIIYQLDSNTFLQRELESTVVHCRV